MEYVDWRGFKVHPDNIPLARPGVYEFRCLVNGKPYIGITGVKTGIEGRCWRSAQGHSGPKFAGAIRKYGASSFVLTPLFYVIGEVDRTWLSQLETDLITENDSVKNGYNLKAADGGSGPYGEEFGAILRVAFARPEAKARQSAASRARQTPEMKEKLSISARIRQADPKFKARQSAMARAACARPEVKAKRLAVARIRNALPEVRAKNSASLLITLAKPEVKARQSAAQREAKARPEVKARMIIAAIARQARMTPEKRSENTKKSWISRRANAAKRAMENQGD